MKLRTLFAAAMVLAACAARPAFAFDNRDAMILPGAVSLSTTRIVLSASGVVQSWTIADMNGNTIGSGIITITFSASNNGNQQYGLVAWGVSQTGGVNMENAFPVWSSSNREPYTRKFAFTSTGSGAAPQKTLYFYDPSGDSGVAFVNATRSFYVEVQSPLMAYDGTQLNH